MKAYLILMIVVVFASYCHADEISVVVTNISTPTLGMPQEARKAKLPGNPHVLGTWSYFLTNATQTTIRFYNKDWASDDKGARVRLIALMGDERSEVWGQIVWAQPVLEATVEGTIRYRNGKEGRFIMWTTVGCFQDSELSWLFIAVRSNIE